MMFGSGVVLTGICIILCPGGLTGRQLNTTPAYSSPEYANSQSFTGFLGPDMIYGEDLDLMDIFMILCSKMCLGHTLLLQINFFSFLTYLSYYIESKRSIFKVLKTDSTQN